MNYADNYNRNAKNENDYAGKENSCADFVSDNADN
jgi:hypothetical protein